MKTSFVLAHIILAVAAIIAANLASAADNGPRPGTVGAALGATSEDGARSAAAGASLYNGMHPEHPMPVLGEDGKVLHDTITNMGAGQRPKEAYVNAVTNETRLPEPKPVKDQASAPAPAPGHTAPVPAPAPATTTERPGGHPANGGEGGGGRGGRAGVWAGPDIVRGNIA